MFITYKSTPKISPDFHRFSTVFAKLSLLVASISLLSTLFINLNTFAWAEGFDPNYIFKTNDLYSTPVGFHSAEAIQAFLVSKNSVLASQKISYNLHKNNSNQYLLTTNTYYQPSAGYLTREGQTVSFAQFVWDLTRTDVGSGCSSTYTNLCFNNQQKLVNPAFILAKIQKESGLVYGACAQPNADNNNNCFYTQLYNQSPGTRSHYLIGGRLERATGYYCFETQDKTKGCWDENPDWIIYKGLFRQVYHMLRRLQILEQMCIAGQPYSFVNFRGDHAVGKTMLIGSFWVGEQGMGVINTWIGATGNVRWVGSTPVTVVNEPVGGTPVYLGNGITCAMYVYTPHISDLMYRILRDIGGMYDYRDAYNLPDDYVPEQVDTYPIY